MPYLWTDGLRNDDFCGAGIYADVVLNFDGANIRISVNGRPMGEASYAADHNDYENRIVHTEGFRCVDGMIGDLEFRDGYNRDRQLFAKLTGDDGEVSSLPEGQVALHHVLRRNTDAVSFVQMISFQVYAGQKNSLSILHFIK